jgi:hypothetical protein
MTGYLQERIDLRVFLTIPESRNGGDSLALGSELAAGGHRLTPAFLMATAGN